MQNSKGTRQQTTKRDTKLRTRMRRRWIDVSSSVVGLRFYTSRGNYHGRGLLPAEATSRSLEHQAEEPGHGHLHERRRVVERSGENSGGQRTKRGVNERERGEKKNIFRNVLA